MSNPHKGMVLCTTWLTEAEVLSFKESLKYPERNWAMKNLVEIIVTSNKRGDLKINKSGG